MTPSTWILAISIALVSVSLFAVIVLTLGLLWFGRKLEDHRSVVGRVNDIEADVTVLRKEVVQLRTSKAGTVSNQKRRAQTPPAESEELPQDQVSELEKPTLFTKNQMRDLLLLKVPGRGNVS